MTAAAPKRLPLRAYVENGREAELRKAWAEGHTFYPWKERDPIGNDKPIEEQTLDDLCGGNAAKVIAALESGRTPNYGEPQSESRRCFLATGGKVLSADVRRKLFGDDETVALIDVIPDDPERNDRMYRGVMYELPSPQERARILREQQYAFSSGDIRLGFVADENGNLRVESKKRGFFTKEQFMNAARSLYQSFDKPKDMAELQYRLDLLFDAIDTGAVRYRDAYAPQEQWRFTAPADDEWHTASNEYGPDEDHEPGDPWVLQATHFRRPKFFDPNYDLWHAQGRDTVEFELGFDLIGDEALEELLGEPKEPFDPTMRSVAWAAMKRLDATLDRIANIPVETLRERVLDWLEVQSHQMEDFA